MTLQWPTMLFALAAIPLAVAAYVLKVRRRDARADLASLRVQDPLGRRRRHIVFGLFLLASAIMIAALSRPEATVANPRFEGTVILAIDTSASMAADDMAPTRLEAARIAAREFVEAQPGDIDVGLVSFSNNGALLEPPTDDPAPLLAAIDRLDAEGGTSLSQALFTALETIVGEPLIEAGAAPDDPIDTASLGFHGSSIVLVLSDGEDTTETEVTTMAEVSSALGVEVFAIGFGTEAGAVIQIEDFSLATRLQEASLVELVDATGGDYRRAVDDDSITDLFDRVDTQFTTDGEPTELTAHVALAGAIVLILASLLSMRWFGRVP
ncbi:MAG: VWA domain-containing protein [Actinomycetota bacterium]